MPGSTKPSRRRFVVERSSDTTSNPNPNPNNRSPGVFSIERRDGDGDGKAQTKPRTPHRIAIGCLFRFLRFPSSRKALTIATMLAMIGFGIGIMSGIYAFLSPPKQFVPRVVSVGFERSSYKYNSTTTVNDQPRTIDPLNPANRRRNRNRNKRTSMVLGKWPPPSPGDNDKTIVYEPSALETYVIDNGRKLGYDRQIVVVGDNKNIRFRQQAATKKLSSTPGDILSLFRHLRTIRNSGNSNQQQQPTKTSYVVVDYNDMPSGCDLWVNPELVTMNEQQLEIPELEQPEIYNGLQTFRTELEDYESLLSDWTWKPPKGYSWLQWGSWSWNSVANDESSAKADEPLTSSSSSDDKQPTEQHDLRDFLDETTSSSSSNKKAVVCGSLEIHPKGLRGIFNSPLSLSAISELVFDDKTTGQPMRKHTFVEPFLPPLRHPGFCDHHYEQLLKQKQNSTSPTTGSTNDNTIIENNNNHNRFLTDTNYIVHDFAAMCRNNLHKHTKTVFIDIDDTSFGDDSNNDNAHSTLSLIRLYQRFGFVFDHIYGYGVAPRPDVLKHIPDDLKFAYHYTNIGKSFDGNSRSSNPFRFITETLEPDDFVVVKLSPKNPDIAIPLAHRLIENEFDRWSRDRLTDRIDVLYFSDRFFAMKELAITDATKGSMQDSMEFFAGLREHGIAAHYWI